MLTARVIFLSKYFSNANEKINSENIAISNEGISVNKPNDIMYFLFAIDPLTGVITVADLLDHEKQEHYGLVVSFSSSGEVPGNNIGKYLVI